MAENENIDNAHFFEGVEKLLEIWFTPNDANKNADLRKIPRWVPMTNVSNSFSIVCNECACGEIAPQINVLRVLINFPRMRCINYLLDVHLIVVVVVVVVIFMLAVFVKIAQFSESRKIAF